LQLDERGLGKGLRIRILHVFSPYAKKKFSGDIIFWRSIFMRWHSDSVDHIVLDLDRGNLVKAKEYFKFEYPEKQQDISQLSRATWIIHLFKNLVRHRKDYDIIHVHIMWWGGLLIGPWAKYHKIPALSQSVLLHSDTPNAIQKEFLGNIKVSCLRAFKKILTISDGLQNDFLDCGFEKEQVFNLMNPVDENIFRPIVSDEEKIYLRKELSLPQDADIIIFVGSVRERKGVHYLINAFVNLSQTYPDLYLLIIGPKTISESPSLDENYISTIYDILEQNKKTNRVCFPGFIQDKDLLSKYYRASDVFVLPSQQEGLANVILEAMASGLPVVVTELPGLKNVIVHLENGLFLSTLSSLPSEISRTISLLIENDSLKKNLGNNASATISKNHTYENWQGELAQFYARLLFSH